MPNVLKVFLENGQTKSFKYDDKTTVKVTSINHAFAEWFAFTFRHLKLKLLKQFPAVKDEKRLCL